MANTTYLKTVVEDYVRKSLEKEFSIGFTSRQLTLQTGGQHQLDAVSKDGQIVAGIKSASGKTAGRKIPSGKVQGAEAELYYLTLVSAPTRLLILTNPDFYEIFSKRIVGRLAPGLELILMALPEEIQEKVNGIQSQASREVLSNRG